MKTPTRWKLILRTWLCVWAVLLGTSALLPAAEPLVVDLWPGPKIPGDVGIAGEEKFIELKVQGKSYEVGGKPTQAQTYALASPPMQ